VLPDLFKDTAWTSLGLDVLKTLGSIAVVLLLARLVIVLANRVIDRLATGHNRHRPVFDERRVQTLATVAKSVVRYGLDFAAVVTALSLVGIDTSSLLLGAGVAGIAIGFGAQNLVRDVISGFFILLEDQYAVGDYVNLGAVEGIVEEIGLRTTQVRAFGGELNTLPNGTIPRVTNFSRGPLRVMFDVTVPYEEDTLTAMRVIQEALDRFRSASTVVVEGPTVLGVSRLTGAGVSVRVWARVKEMEHWAVERELKLQIKEALDRAGVGLSSLNRIWQQPPGPSPESGQPRQGGKG
jgi:small-conductance mechanosensitive channel